jgi:hypothetical protein
MKVYKSADSDGMAPGVLRKLPNMNHLQWSELQIILKNHGELRS